MNYEKNTVENKLTILPKSAQDLKQILLYFEGEINYEYIDSLESKVVERFNQLLVFPKLYPKLDVKEFYELGLRKSILDRYIIIYSYLEEKNEVRIVRVLHAKMQQEQIFQ